MGQIKKPLQASSSFPMTGSCRKEAPSVSAAHLQAAGATEKLPRKEGLWRRKGPQRGMGSLQACSGVTQRGNEVPSESQV